MLKQNSFLEKYSYCSQNSLLSLKYVISNVYSLCSKVIFQKETYCVAFCVFYSAWQSTEMNSIHCWRFCPTAQVLKSLTVWAIWNSQHFDTTIFLPLHSFSVAPLRFKGLEFPCSKYYPHHFKSLLLENIYRDRFSSLRFGWNINNNIYKHFLGTLILS